MPGPSSLNRCHFCSAAQGRAKISGQRPDQSFISIAKGLKSGPLLRAFIGFRGAYHSADDAAGGSFRFEELGKSRTEAELFRVAGVDAGDERSDEFVEEFGRKLAARKCSDGFACVGRGAVAEGVTENAPFCASTEKGRGEKRRWA